MGDESAVKRGRNNKRKGAAAERECVRILEAGYDSADGYRRYLAAKTGGSLGVWDIFGIPVTMLGNRAVSPVLIQVKSNRPPARAERTRMSDSACEVVAFCWCWVRYDGGGGRPARWTRQYIDGCRGQWSDPETLVDGTWQDLR